MLSFSPPANSRLLVVEFLGSQKLHMDLQLHRALMPQPCIVQGSVNTLTLNDDNICPFSSVIRVHLCDIGTHVPIHPDSLSKL